MLGLPRDFRFSVKNETGSLIESGYMSIDGRRVKYDTAGALSYESSGINFFQCTGIANNAFQNGKSFSNSVDKYLAGNFLATITSSGTAGSASIFMDISVDSGNTWSTNNNSYFVQFVSGVAKIPFTI